MKNSVRIFYCGLPLGAEMLRLHGHSPVMLALGPPDAPGAAHVTRRLPNAETFLDPDLSGSEIRGAIERTRPEALISFFWLRKIPRDLLEAMPLGAFGTHPSLLPAWPGPDPYFWAIRSGAAKTGVTLHRLVEEYDEGAVIAQRVLAVPPNINSWGLAKALDRPAIGLIRWCADALGSGRALMGDLQDPFTTHWARVPRRADLRIDWQEPVGPILRLIRAAAPEPGAQALFGETPVEVLRAAEEREPAPSGLQPAEAWRSSRGWAVRCGGGSVRLEEIRGMDGHRIELDTLFVGGPR